MKKTLLLLLLLSACATAAPVSVPESEQGCWIEHRGPDIVTLRWDHDGEGPGWRADIEFARDGRAYARQAYVITPTPGDRHRGNWGICRADARLPSGAMCEPLYVMGGHRVGNDTEWMMVRANYARLSLVQVANRRRSSPFHGDRASCDTPEFHPSH